MTDPSDWADLVSPGTDLSSAVPTNEYGHCPQCGDVEHRWQIFAEEPAGTPDEVAGPVFTTCLCGNLYRCEGVHTVRADQPIGEATVRSASAPQPVVTSEPMPPGQNNTLDVANEIASRRPAFDPALYMPVMSQQLAAHAHWVAEVQHRRRAVAAFYASNGAAQPILPLSKEQHP